MNCKTRKINFCKLVQETFKSPALDFKDLDISNDTFIYKVNHKEYNTAIYGSYSGFTAL